MGDKKKCVICKKEKPVGDFYTVGNGKYFDNKCKLCRYQKQKETRLKKKGERAPGHPPAKGKESVPVGPPTYPQKPDPLKLYCMRCGFPMELPNPALFAKE